MRSGPPGPTLLDTSVVQHLSMVFELSNPEWTVDSARQARNRFSRSLAVEIAALGWYVDGFVQYGNAPLWAVSRTSRWELSRAPSPKSAELLRWWGNLWTMWTDAIREWPEELSTFAEDDEAAALMGQLEIEFSPPILACSFPNAPSFGPFRDPGDRAIIRDAMRGGFPSILTTDQRSFWRYRAYLFPLGVEVWRPSDLWVSIGGDLEDLFDD